MPKRVDYYVVIVKRNRLGIDKYYRKEHKDAIALEKMNKELYPKATVEVVVESVLEE